MEGAAQGSQCMLVALDFEDRAAFRCLVVAHSGSAATEIHEHLPDAKGRTESE